MGIRLLPRNVGEDHHLQDQDQGRGRKRTGAVYAWEGVKRGEVAKGHLAVYVGENCHKHRFLVPISYLNHPLFQDLLKLAEEEHGYDHPMGGLTISCTISTFLTIISHMNIH